MQDLQLIAAIGIVLAAIGYLASRLWRNRKPGCAGGGCSCAGAKTTPNSVLISKSELTLRKRDSKQT
jgi:hypothetical protein